MSDQKDVVVAPDGAPAPSDASLDEEALAAIHRKVGEFVREAADDFYERVEEGVREYLSENVRFNVSRRIENAEKQVAYYRGRWSYVGGALRAASDALTYPERPEYAERALKKVKNALALAAHRLADGDATLSSSADANDARNMNPDLPQPPRQGRT